MKSEKMIAVMTDIITDLLCTRCPLNCAWVAGHLN